jgi:hypothetical protein
MERDVMLTGGSTGARGEGEEDEGNVLPLLSRNDPHCLWTKKNAEFDNVDCSRLRDCLEVGYMCCEDAELQGSVTGSVAKIARCASTPTCKDGPPRARTSGLCLSRSPKMTRKIFSSTIELFLVLI